MFHLSCHIKCLIIRVESEKFLVCLLFSSRLIVSSPVSSDTNPCPDAIHLRCTSPQSPLVSSLFLQCLSVHVSSTCCKGAQRLKCNCSENISSLTMKHEIMMRCGSHSNAWANILGDLENVFFNITI